MAVGGSEAVEALPAELLAQVKSIQLRTKYLVTEMMSGQYKSAFRGRGMEFQEVREYQPGDDIRRIDWNVTARAGAPFVKQHREERELTIMLVVDVSASLKFGSGAKEKKQIAAEVSALLAFCAAHSNDKVGLLAFSDRIESFIPPKKGRGHTWRVVREIMGHKPQGRGTNLSAAFDYLSHVVRRRAVVFVLSDFIDRASKDRDYLIPLRRAGRRHDITAVHLGDALEQELPRVGLLELVDLESGEARVIDTGSTAFREAHRLQMQKERDALQEALSGARIGTLWLDTKDNYVNAIARYFQTKGAR